MHLKLIIVLVASVFCVGLATDCYDEVLGLCTTKGGTEAYTKTKSLICDAKYGAFKELEILDKVQDFTRSHIFHSYQYLLMSSHFGNFEKNRHGFEKLYRSLSDDTWEKAIDLAKYIGKRGGYMTFPSTNKNFTHSISVETNEWGSMGKALDIQKSLAEDAHRIHKQVMNSTASYDPEVASYLENNFVHKHSDSIRKLSGYTNDLKRLIADQEDPSLSLYLFDDYLQKSVD